MAAEENAQSAAPAGGNKLVMILTVVNLLATVGIGAVVFIGFKKSQAPAVTDIAPDAESAAAGAKEGDAAAKEAAKQAEAEAASRRMVTLEQFTVNLSTPGSAGPKFVRVNISLELPSPESESEVTARMPQVRNTIIDLFNSKRPGDLATAEGRDYLKEEILNALNAFLVNGKVRGVFFTSFAVST